jgi:hypothetical protein
LGPSIRRKVEVGFNVLFHIPPIVSLRIAVIPLPLARFARVVLSSVPGLKEESSSPRGGADVIGLIIADFKGGANMFF